MTLNLGSYGRATHPKRRYDPHRRNDDRLIWNPSTGDSKLILHTHHPFHISIFALIGFTYDLSINDGKIVRVDTYNYRV